MFRNSLDTVRQQQQYTFPWTIPSPALHEWRAWMRVLFTKLFKLNFTKQILVSLHVSFNRHTVECGDSCASIVRCTSSSSHVIIIIPSQCVCAASTGNILEQMEMYANESIHSYYTLYTAQLCYVCVPSTSHINFHTKRRLISNHHRHACGPLWREGETEKNVGSGKTNIGNTTKCFCTLCIAHALLQLNKYCINFYLFYQKLLEKFVAPTPTDRVPGRIWVNRTCEM